MNGSMNLLTGVEGQVVHAALERHDPPVQQLARRALLPAEVVDDQHAAIGQRLDRGRIEAVVARIGEFQGIERELARPP
jgi:hypothetical protein